jgi:HK97 family phage prohead protease
MTASQHKAAIGQQFRFYTSTVKAYKRAAAGGTEDLILKGIASSNQRDRYGDTMSAQCVSSLVAQSKKLTMFGNHDYDVPEDVFGRCDSSNLETEGDVIKLAIVMAIAKSNPRAVKSWELINEDGVRLAFSVGGIITEAEVDVENDDGTGWSLPLIINGLELVEISLCGIPANRESYTRSFLEDIKKSAFRAVTGDRNIQKAFLQSMGVETSRQKLAPVDLARMTPAELQRYKRTLPRIAR